MSSRESKIDFILEAIKYIWLANSQLNFFHLVDKIGRIYNTEEMLQLDDAELKDRLLHIIRVESFID